MKARVAQTWSLWVFWGVVCACPPPAAGKLLAYVSNLYGNTVSVVDTDSNTVGATLPLTDCEGPNKNQSCFPGGIAMLSDGSRGYVTLGYPAGLSGGAVAVLDARTGTFMHRIPVGESPSRVVLTPDESRAYVGNLNDGTLSVIDTRQETVITTISSVPRAGSMAMSPDGKHVYIAENDSSYVWVVDTEMNSVVARIDVGQDEVQGRHPRFVAVTPDSRRVYIANSGSGAISVADAETNTVVALLTPSGRFSLPSAIAISPDGRLAYGVTGQPQHLQEIDVGANTMRDTGLLLPYMGEIAITPDGGRAYFVNGVYNFVEAVDLRGYRVVAKIPLGDGPNDIALAPAPDSLPSKTPSASDRSGGSIQNLTVTSRPSVPSTPSGPPTSGTPKPTSPTPQSSDPAPGTSGCSLGPGATRSVWGFALPAGALSILRARRRRPPAPEWPTSPA